MATRNPYRRSLTPESESIDARVALLGRGFASLRLALGEGLAQMETVGGFRRLGFPTLESYAREALGRTGRWASDVRGLASKATDGRPQPDEREAPLAGPLSFAGPSSVSAPSGRPSAWPLGLRPLSRGALAPARTADDDRTRERAIAGGRFS